MFMNVTESNREQTIALWEKHIKPPVIIPNRVARLFNKKPLKVPPLNVHFSWDDEDELGFVSFTTCTGKKVSYQFRGTTPCFVEVTGFATRTTRYDISYPEKHCKELFDYLQGIGVAAKDNWLKGGQI